MPISSEPKYAAFDKLCLDGKNPRLGRHETARRLSQGAILKLMQDWTLDELAVSFIESGFWPQESLLAVAENGRLVVVEGNRRLASLKLLFQAKSGNPISPKWKDIAKSASRLVMKKLKEVPYLQATSRKEIQAYLGFRHVTGIKQWGPAQKAEFIACLVEQRGMSYEQVRRVIGSKTPTVRQNYISYRLLLQMEGMGDDVSVEHVEEKFSVLYLSLRSAGVQKYLNVDILAPPGKTKRPVPRSHLAHLVDFARWLFGDGERAPLVTDSRLVDKFGRILESPKAVSYLERTDSPQFETAYRLAGGDEEETTRMVEEAADAIEQALSTAHHHRKSKRLQQAVERLGTDALQLLNLFPKIRDLLIPRD